MKHFLIIFSKQLLLSKSPKFEKLSCLKQKLLRLLNQPLARKNIKGERQAFTRLEHNVDEFVATAKDTSSKLFKVKFCWKQNRTSLA